MCMRKIDCNNKKFKNREDYEKNTEAAKKLQSRIVEREEQFWKEKNNL